MQTFLTRVDAVAGALVFFWVGAMSVQIVRDQIALSPPRPPTPEEVSAATPRAMANWATVRARLAMRIPNAAELEFGAVWATRTGRICGLVNDRDTGVDHMVRFYTLDLFPIFQFDSEQRYFRTWATCQSDHWVQLHSGSDQTGFCASDHGRRTRLGRRICPT